jgi:serine/threonine-protein kinase
MSDFLSQFENKSDARPSAPLHAQPEPPAPSPSYTQELPQLQPQQTHQQMQTQESPRFQTQPVDHRRPVATGRGIKAVEHRVEVDPDYQRSRLRRRILIVAAVVAVALIAVLVWHFSRLVEVPDFAGKQLSEAQTFARDNNVELEVTEEYRLDVDKGLILSQGVEAGKTITQGSTLALTASLGPDPSEHLELPDFATMKRSAAEAWIAQWRADNLRIVQEYSDTVEKDGFLRLEFRTNELSADNYRRSDYATLYYSKGAETFEKNITVPNFANKTRADVETWVATNSLKLTIEEEDSDTIAAGLIISQSIKAGEKVAKHDGFAIVVSLGKAIIVPNFANYTAETAAGAAGQVPIKLETRFSPDVPYGQLIWQSVASGTRLKPDELETVTVIYSEGRPYLKDYRGTSEGELPATFFRDYTSKGANVSYDIVYVDSYEPKGTIVGMSDYSRFIPLDFYVVIQVSLGNLTPPAPEPPTTP